MKTGSKIGPEGIVDVCIELFNKIKHLETETSTLIYDITSTYFYSTKLSKARLGYNRDDNSLPQINIGLVATKNKGLPVLFRTYEGNITDVRTVEQLIADVKRVDLSIDAIIMDRGMASKNNLLKLNGDKLKIIAGIPLTSNEAKDLVMHDISDENELMRPSGLIYYEDFATSLFDIPGRAIICFKNWLDLQPVRHFEEGNIDVYIFICYLAYLNLALYKHHLGVAGWEGVEDSLDELGRIRKTTLDFGGERRDKISVLTKEQKEIIEKLGFADALFGL